MKPSISRAGGRVRLKVLGLACAFIASTTVALAQNCTPENPLCQAVGRPVVSCVPGMTCVLSEIDPCSGTCKAAAGGAGGGVGGAAGGGMPLLIQNQPLTLIQSPTATAPGELQALPQQPGIQIFFTYFNLVWPWILGIAAGIAVLQALVGGIQIMLSGGSEQRNAGQTRLMWALGGLVLVALSGFILRMLNPLFYR